MLLRDSGVGHGASVCWRVVGLGVLAAVVGAAVFFAGTSVARAEEPEHRWAIGPWAGMYKLVGGIGDRATVGPEGGFGLEYLLDDEETFSLGTRIGYGENDDWEVGTYKTMVFSADLYGKFNVDLDSRFDPYGLLGFGMMMWRSEYGSADVFTLDGKKAEGTESAIRLGLGVVYDLTERWYVDGRLTGSFIIREDDELDFGGLYDPNDKELQASLGFCYRFSGGYHAPKDTDRDGVTDDKDRCPDTPGCTRVDRQGCPVSTSADTDRDGVPNTRDECPDTPYGAVVDRKGCPHDTDGDGVYDGIDQCPGTEAGLEVDRRGCPQDSDGDGVFDGPDRCPNTPRGAVVNRRGCPQDSDGDGVFDGIDQCPNTPPGSRVDALGCAIPPPEPERVILEGVNFRTGTDELLPRAQTVLDEIARDLVEDLTDLRLEIHGYTDAVGTEETNLNLSRRRAESVRNYLMSKGVAGDRLTAIGFGEADPVAPNNTPEGRSQNRRVEFRVSQ